MGYKPVILAITLVFVVVSSVAVVHLASCTEANHDWVYVTTITGNKSQDINITELVPSQYLWGVRGRYTASGDASLELLYAGSDAKDSINGEKGTGTYILDFDPERNASQANGLLKVRATNVISYELNIYYDTNIGETPSPRLHQRQVLLQTQRFPPILLLY